MPRALDFTDEQLEEMGDQDPAALIHLLEGNDPDPADEIVAAAPQTVEPTEPEAQEQPKATETPTEPVTSDDENQVILTRDGKGQIPFDVLKRERQGRAQAWEEREQFAAQNAELQSKIAQMQAQLAAGTQLTPEQADASAEAINEMDERLEEMGDYMPEQAVALYKDFNNTIAALKTEIADMNSAEQSRQAQVNEAQNATLQEAVNEAVDSIPDLLKWAQVWDGGGNSPQYEAALHYDAALMQDPQWLEKPTVDRLREATRLAGGTNLGGDGVSAGSKGVTEAHVEQLTPVTLSDLPSGSMVAADEVEAVESMTMADLSHKLGSMNQDQQDAYLARFG